MSTTISNSGYYDITLGAVPSPGTYTSPLTITSTGTVENSASAAAIYALNTAIVANYGTVLATAPGYFGIDFKAGGYVLNAATGLISGFFEGVNFYGAAATVHNFGTIETNGQAGSGIRFLSGGTVNNEAGGLITGSFDGVSVSGGTGAVANSGTIEGGRPASISTMVALSTTRRQRH